MKGRTITLDKLAEQQQRSKSAPMAEHAIINVPDDELELSNRCYYAGVSYDWSLLATTTPNPHVLQNDPLPNYSRKRIACVGSHAITDLWEELTRIIEPLNTKGAWLVLGCYRIGNKANADNENPVVVLLHVKAGMLLETDGEALAEQILVEYKKL
jgi:hypothetical protein